VADTLDVGSPSLALVIGQPIEHSLSPMIYNTAFAIDNLNWKYSALEVSKEQAQDFINDIREDKYVRGVSVTMPLKEAVIPYLDQLTEAANELKAVNCIYWEEETLTGHNTDGDGFINSLIADTGEGIPGSVFAVVGAGGAARSVIRSLRQASAEKIIVINRNHEKAEFAAELGGENAEVGTLDSVTNCKYVINATSIGMAGTDNEGMLPLAARYLTSSQTVIDLVYNPIETPLLLEARKKGATAISGIGMLVHQAALQYQLWTGNNAPIEKIQKEVINIISKNN